MVVLCQSGYTKEICPYNNAYSKCVVGSCESLGYTLIAGSLAPICLNATVEYCPTDKTKYKCVTDSTAQQCIDAGYTAAACLNGIDTIYIYNSSYHKCKSVFTTDKCSIGWLASDTTNICVQNSCKTYGIKPNGGTSTQGNTCYSCCTASDASGLTVCVTPCPNL